MLFHFFLVMTLCILLSTKLIFSKNCSLTPVAYLEPTSRKATGALFFLHGTGENGPGFKKRIQLLTGFNAAFPHIRTIFPTAPLTSYTPLLGFKLNTWYDITSFSFDATENDKEIQDVASKLTCMVEEQESLGIPRERMAFAGFSRGGSMSFHMAFTYIKSMAGMAAVASFLTRTSQVYKSLEDDQRTPPFLQLNGRLDLLVSTNLANETYQNLISRGANGSFCLQPLTGHTITAAETQQIYKFINEVIPDYTN